MKKRNIYSGREKIFILAVLALGIFLRAVLLNEIPPGLANDEANIVLNAQSFLHTGRNIPGVVTGVIGNPTGNYIGGVHSELSSFVLSFVYLLMGFSISASKLPFVFASFGIIIFIYLTAKELLNRQIARIALLLSAVNPWLIHFGRARYEAILSTFFYIGSFYIFLKTRGWKIFFALPFLLIGFFCYFSAKVLIIPISLSLILFVALLRPKESLKPVIALNVFVAVFVVVYMIILNGSFSGRRIFELKNISYAPIVDYNRTHSIYFPLQKAVENKYIENLYIRLRASLGMASANFLFLNGMPESSGHLSIPDQGPMYFLDLFLLIVGFAYLFRKYGKTAIILGFFIAAAFLPNFLNIQNTTYSMRHVILIPILIIVVASGVYGLYESIPGRKLRFIYVVITTTLYLFLFSRFVFQYYYRMPIENNDSWFFKDRIASNYIRLLSQKDPDLETVWIAPQVHYTFYRYLFFSGIYNNTENIKAINDLLENKIYKVGNVSLQNVCPEYYDTDAFFYVIDANADCKIPETVAIIANINDAGVKYRFINDPLCGGYIHKRYPFIKEHRMLNVENLSEEEFCVNYISNNQAVE